VVCLVRHITAATNTVTTAATTATTTTITADANAIAAFVLLMTPQINDSIQIYWHRYAWLIIVFYINVTYRRFISLTFSIH